MSLLLPEYPTLSPAEIAEGATKRREKSRRKYVGRKHGVPAVEPWMRDAVGDFGDFEHASTSSLDQWLQGWRMPNGGDGSSDAQSSAAVFVGVAESSEMPSASPVTSGPPFITVTSGFIHTCTAIADTFPAFSTLIAGAPSVDLAHNARAMLFAHLDPSTASEHEYTDIIHGTRDKLFTARSTAAAVRWAIAHEMAHIVAGPKARAAAYERASTLWPGMEEDQWFSKRDRLPNFRGSIDNYRKEIACDMLANEYVLNSPFAADDLMTQVSGALLALEALIWHGWFHDESKISDSHPSPTLRFRLILLDWLDRLTKAETWANRSDPGFFGMKDFAYWNAFERWGSGEYGPHRRGNVWRQDIQRIEKLLSTRGPLISVDQIYVGNEDGIFRAPNSRP